ncbi:MAG: cytochrome c biogenesis protein CcsA [Alphaproteobacteria bacterium]|nr:cytochrome c biogenesis protein CcsA [Alphaproteobacteria bacterium]
MNGSIIFGIAALLTLLPAALLPAQNQVESAQGEGRLFWLLLSVATVGPIALDISAGGGLWQSGFSATLWTIVAGTMLVYFAICLVSRSSRKLRALLLPYLVILSVIALLWSSVPDTSVAGSSMTVWLQVHIGVSLVTYALITVAATAALGVWLKERALRSRKMSRLVDGLPAVSDGESTQLRLLTAAEIVLGLGLLSGMATQFFIAGSLMALDHKTTLSIAAFLVLGVLLMMQRSSGLRGRNATRLVLMTYLLMTLAFPGVKFVTDVVLS